MRDHPQAMAELRGLLSNGRLYTVKLILLSIPADIPLMRSPIKLNVFLPADYMQVNVAL